jgi:hypothetical protein
VTSEDAAHGGQPPRAGAQQSRRADLEFLVTDSKDVEGFRDIGALVVSQT